MVQPLSPLVWQPTASTHRALGHEFWQRVIVSKRLAALQCSVRVLISSLGYTAEGFLTQCEGLFYFEGVQQCQRKTGQ